MSIHPLPPADRPFEHMTRNGLSFSSQHADLSGEITIHAYREFIPEEIAAGVAEMIGFHATVVRPELDGFQGYDCLVFKIKLGY